MKFITVFLLAVALVATPSCAVRKNPNLTTAQKNEYNVNQLLASVATLNNGIAKDVVAVDQSGLVKDKRVIRLILSYNKNVAQADNQAIALAQQANVAWADRAKGIYDILKNVKLPGAVSTFLNTPTNEQAVKALITAIGNVQAAIEAALKGVQ